MKEIKERPYGSWRSTISAASVAQSGKGSNLHLSELKLGNGNVYWLERSLEHDGSRDLVRMSQDGAIATLVSAPLNVRTRVHEYGGGSYCIWRDVVFFSNFEDQRLYRIENGDVHPITPKSSDGRYADAIVTQDGSQIIAVRERHVEGGKAINELVAVPANGNELPRILSTGRDFYSSPRLSADGSQLAWLCWDHPHMPWDQSELWVAYITENLNLENESRVAGTEQESIYQPEWGAKGELYFISDRSGWWNIYRQEDGETIAIAPMKADFGIPQWQLGTSRYTILSNDSVACIYTRDGVDQFGILDPGAEQIRKLDLPFTSYYPPAIYSDEQGTLWTIAGSYKMMPSVVRIDSQREEFQVIRKGFSGNLDLNALSTPQAIHYPTKENARAYAFYYPPANPNFRGAQGELPPLIVSTHGGPTSSARSHLQMELQYWTSRGFAIVDINYGGSSGFGRQYRERLRGKWGVVDVNDCIAAAQFLIEEGRVDGRRIVIRGSSAGGFTTLAALVNSNRFAVGTSYYGISDLKSLASETHKFEAYYLDYLIGPLPEFEAVYQERSPLANVANLSSPMIIFQGSDDIIVPPSQAQIFIEALEEKHIPYAYVEFENEGHGIRQPKNIIRSLEMELAFYSHFFDLELPSANVDLIIHNL